MPALPWIGVSEPQADATYVVMASRLPLRSYARIPSFLRATSRIRRQLATADGLVGYSLDAKLLAKTFWTLSAWRNQAALVRGHERVPVCGQLEVPTGGHLEVPTPR